MKIARSINADVHDIQNWSFNYWIGTSLGNKYFSKENVGKYIDWAVTHTKDSVLVLVPDWIYAINIEVLDRKNPEKAARRALRLGDSKLTDIEDIVASLPAEHRSRITSARWEDIARSDIHRTRVDILFEEFDKKEAFYFSVTEIVRASFRSFPRQLDMADIEKLAQYVLHELPVFLDGIHLFGRTYNANLYPKIGLIDVLEKDLQEGSAFPELTRKLRIKDPAVIIEAYVE